ncbi:MULTISPECIES: AbrB/MazE/SpoVT family DNA-binding domain-containing protein [unclassified Mesorhizobium]|uniref:AbrB/MazE/SpoVT family DNA-binding domain-containing protein n=1 Tax=unclassified Mesorhizobium TaxID=325217 RepID=UPI001CC9D74F|nr:MULTISPECIES: AbrB/MazE/SpoVT family DNA-binding domain-containing protein [unclassified Mesorhizobium]MBZ9740961.1 AbrB/MazE/SpoVT family DNA-binding domain-containing protein [Mesorhizobium sp. CO1-1-4]MBZ9804432.1 AbrB/MazE/SpoVT family DNA-binding domain-containing protein [Mesorhizobium sp. ES1-6]
MSVVVTTKGKVTILKPIRDLLGIVPGSRVDFRRAADGTIALTRVDKRPDATRFARLRGHAGAGLTTDAIMALMRGATLS